MLPAALGSVEIVLATTAAHTWAGGELPSGTWLATLTAVVFVASLLVTGQVVRRRWMVPTLAAAQLLLHVAMTASAGPAHHGHSHAAGAMSPLDGLVPSGHMLTAHLVSAAATALIWHLRRRILHALVRRPLAARTLPVRRWAPSPVVVVGRPTRCAWPPAAPRRGPPLALRRA